MKSTLLYLKNLCLGIVVGKIVFFAFVLAPRVFKVLPREDAARLQNSLFPSYYLLELISFSVLAFILFIVKNKCYAPKIWQANIFKWSQLFCLVALGISVYSYYFMLPQMFSLYQAGLTGAIADASAQFHSFHRLSVILNSSTLFITLFLIRGTQAET